MLNIFTDQEPCTLYTSIHQCLLSNDTDLYQVTCFEQEYPDESYIKVLTYYTNHPEETDFEEISKVISSYLPEELREPFTENDHITLFNQKNDSIEIHFNDASITLILHGTGQW